jgi:RNA polymerase sigma-70 factor (ECF subfamily)
MQTVAVTEKVSPFEATRVVSAPNAQSSNVKSWSNEMAAVANARDRASFMRIYDHFSPRVLRYLQSLGCAEMVAEELTQEALLRLWQRADSYDPQRSKLSTWLFRIARNLYIDRIRREPHWVDTQDWIEQVDANADAPIAARPAAPPDAFAEHVALQQRIDALPAAQARLIRMSYFEARTHQEIAAELQMPLGTVKSTLRRAFLKLQLAIGKTA